MLFVYIFCCLVFVFSFVAFCRFSFVYIVMLTVWRVLVRLWLYLSAYCSVNLLLDTWVVVGDFCFSLLRVLHIGVVLVELCCGIILWLIVKV